jgi:hypothetical protein
VCDEQADTGRVLALLLARTPGEYEKTFFALLDDEQGSQQLAIAAPDCLLWWQLQAKEPDFEAKKLLLACVAVYLKACRANGQAPPRLWEGMVSEILGGGAHLVWAQSERSIDLSEREVWLFLSRLAVAGIGLQRLPAPLTAARRACSALLDCDFITAARAVTVLGATASGADPARTEELTRFETAAVRYLAVLAIMKPNTLIAWEVKLIASQQAKCACLTTPNV